MIIRTNPVVANYDVLFFGKKGFSSLAKAKIIKYRPKGDKSAPWVVIDVSKIRKKLDKQRILFRHLEEARRLSEKSKKQQFKIEEREERKRLKTLLATKEVKTKKTIKFKRVKGKKPSQYAVKSKTGEHILVQNYVFETEPLLNFVSGTRSPNSIQIEQFMMAVGEKFKEVFRKHKKTDYFLRITHRYKALKSKKGKKRFDGFAFPRTRIDSTRDIDSLIKVMIDRYLPTFEKYLKFATNNTSFDFLGFIVEATVKSI